MGGIKPSMPVSFHVMECDIVYILKADIRSEEIKYSLRSVEANFPHRKVWFFCGCPEDIKPDEHVKVRQYGRNKWQMATSTYRTIAKTSNLSEKFWLFNDDFFVMEPVDELPYMYRGQLSERVEGLRAKYNVSSYGNMLDDTRRVLEAKGLTTYDYALHVPMLLERTKVMEVLDAFPREPMFRSLYGNYFDVGGVKAPDVKIYDDKTLPKEGQVLVSTNDVAFRDGRVGDYIRQRFAKPSKWEKEHVESI